MKQISIIIVFLFSFLGLNGCSSNNKDPFENYNRKAWNFNYTVLDPYLVRPVSIFYKNYTPSPVRVGVSNVISNIEEPMYVLSSLFAGKVNLAGDHFARLLINSVFGIGGLFDFATAMDITPEKYDLSAMLGYYGVKNGPFLMIPFYGPVTSRSFVGSFANNYLPYSVYLRTSEKVGKWMLNGIDERGKAVSQESLLNQSTDTYLFVRDAFLQRQAYLASFGQIDIKEDENQDFDDLLNE